MMFDCIVRGRTFSATPLCDRRMSGRANLSLSIMQTHTNAQSCCVLAECVVCVCVETVWVCVFMKIHITLVCRFL